MMLLRRRNRLKFKKSKHWQQFKSLKILFIRYLYPYKDTFYYCWRDYLVFVFIKVII